MQLILGSQSPRRKEILSYFSIPFEQHSPDFDERSIPYENNPADYVSKLSDGKALSLAESFPDALLLTADTIVVHQNKIYCKPESREEAFQFITELNNTWHSVYTGVTLLKNGILTNKVEETRVLMNPLTPGQINHYLDQLQWSDKAGGYAIQNAGGLIVSRIDGCFYNVMGLPINSVQELLLGEGVDLWEHL